MIEFCVECGKPLSEEDEDMVCNECFEKQEFFNEDVEELDFND